MKKHCRQCEKDVRVADFYRHPHASDGLQAVCKSCHRANVRENYRRNRERYAEYEKGRANLPHRIEARKAYQQSPNGRSKSAAAKRRFAERNPIKRAAHIASGNAIRDGRIKRQPCEVCGLAKAQAHHDDYTKPLEVRWLCTTHHAEWHRHNIPITRHEEAA